MYVGEENTYWKLVKIMKERELGRPSCRWEDVDWIPAPVTW